VCFVYIYTISASVLVLGFGQKGLPFSQSRTHVHTPAHTSFVPFAIFVELVCLSKGVFSNFIISFISFFLALLYFKLFA